MQGLRCVEMFLTRPVVEFRSMFENVVKTHQINTKIVGQILRLLIKCRDDIKSDNMDESIAAWERFYADDVDVEKKTNTSRLFDSLLHSSLSSFLKKKKSKPSPPVKPPPIKLPRGVGVSTKEQVHNEQRMMKLVGFLRDFYGKYVLFRVTLIEQKTCVLITAPQQKKVQQKQCSTRFEVCKKVDGERENVKIGIDEKIF